MTKNNDNNLNGKERWFESRIAFMVMMGSALASIILFIIMPIKNIEKDIAVIQISLNKIETNELVHIQDKLDDHDVRMADVEKILERIKEKLGIQ